MRVLCRDGGELNIIAIDLITLDIIDCFKSNVIHSKRGLLSYLKKHILKSDERIVNNNARKNLINNLPVQYVINDRVGILLVDQYGDIITQYIKSYVYFVLGERDLKTGVDYYISDDVEMTKHFSDVVNRTPDREYNHFNPRPRGLTADIF